ncbi:MAG: hypothetical protein M3416_00535 [Acidobacteriota bacterium]|nr:hypothetical protein [Acidobacteriota bacterium]
MPATEAIGEDYLAGLGRWRIPELAPPPFLGLAVPDSDVSRQWCRLIAYRYHQLVTSLEGKVLQGASKELFIIRHAGVSFRL